MLRDLQMKLQHISVSLQIQGSLRSVAIKLFRQTQCSHTDKLYNELYNEINIYYKNKHFKNVIVLVVWETI